MKCVIAALSQQEFCQPPRVQHIVLSGAVCPDFSLGTKPAPGPVDESLDEGKPNVVQEFPHYN